MRGLIPTELHRYSILDVFRGLAVARHRASSLTTIFLPGLGDGISLRSARVAIIIALKALQMPPGSRIGVPLYCCPVVFKAIKAAGCTPRFLDIEPETFCLSLEDLRKKCSGIDALIAVHMFGNLCDMPRILEITGDKPVIEDCAQSIDSKLNSKMCGSFGDISFFSFRSGKYLSVGEGGALFSNKAVLRKRISDLVADLPAPTRLDELKHILEIYLRSKLRSRPLWGLIGAKIWTFYNRKTEFVDKSPIVPGRIFVADLATVRRRIPNLGQMIAVQRANAKYFDHNLHLDPRMLFREGTGNQSNRFMYTIFSHSTEQRDAVAASLRRRGVDVATPYQEILTSAAQYYGYEGDCPSAERALKTVLAIPSYYTLKSKDLAHIVQSVNEAYSSFGKKRAIRPSSYRRPFVKYKSP